MFSILFFHVTFLR